MSDRLLRVNAYTTLDLVEGAPRARVRGRRARRRERHGSPEDPEHVTLEVELDNTAIDDLPAHADEVDLSPAQAQDARRGAPRGPRRRARKTATAPYK